jgi:hypothetical protein
MAESRAPESAEARQKKKAAQAIDGQKAMGEYEANMRAMRAKTERLRALRLARDEAEAKIAAENPPAPRKKPAKKKPAAAAPAASETETASS